MNSILLINKPTGMTSHDVVSKIKRLTRLKVGHSGTLDPQASGLLIVLLNKATKLTPFLNTKTKTYRATCTLGIMTDTQDIWGEVIEKREIVAIDKLNEVLESFKGESMQQVPMVSAVRVDGKRLYEYHRENEVVETPIRKIEVFDIRCLNQDQTTFSFEVTVSSGTYIRTLCQDICLRLGTIGTMSALERTAIGDLNLSQAVDLDQLDSVNWLKYTLSIKDVLSHYPMIEVDNKMDVIAGKVVQLDTIENEVILCYLGEVLAVYERIDDSNQFRSKRGLF